MGFSTMTVPTGTFLTEQEIQELTGVKVRQLQTRWLAQRGWPFELDHFNRPVVLRSVMKCKLGIPDKDSESWSFDEASVA